MIDKPTNPHHILTTDAEDKFVSAVMDRIRTTNYSQALRFIIGEQMRINEFDATITKPTTPRPVLRPIVRKSGKPATSLDAIAGLRKGVVQA